MIVSKEFQQKIISRVREELLHVKGDREIEFIIDGQEIWVDVKEWHATDGTGRWGREIHECAIGDENVSEYFENVAIPCADMDMSSFKELDPYYQHLDIYE